MGDTVQRREADGCTRKTTGSGETASACAACAGGQ